MTTTYAASTERLASARRHVHDVLCQPTAGHDHGRCITMTHRLPPRAMRAALAVLDADPRDTAGARRLLHAGVCVGPCTGEQAEQHAAEKFGRQIAALRSFRRTEKGYKP